jgi:hypothetical protein
MKMAKRYLPRARKIIFFTQTKNQPLTKVAISYKFGFCLEHIHSLQTSQTPRPADFPDCPSHEQIRNDESQRLSIQAITKKGNFFVINGG